MKTFISWIIANFEGVLISIVFAISAIILFSNPPMGDDGTILSTKAILELFTISAVFLAALTLQTKSCGVGVIKYLLLLAFLIWGHGILEDSQLQILSWTLAWIVFVGGSVIGIVSAIYVFLNFDDVVSLRMLYRNSSVSLFEIEWQYIIERFTCISFATFINAYWLIFIFKIL
mgnify:FL=1